MLASSGLATGSAVAVGVGIVPAARTYRPGGAPSSSGKASLGSGTAVTSNTSGPSGPSILTENKSNSSPSVVSFGSPSANFNLL